MRRILILIILTINLSVSFAQKDSVSIEEIKNTNLEILKQLEETYDLTIYYRKDWLKTVELNALTSHKNLYSDIEIILENTQLQHHFVDDSTVVLSNVEKVDLSASYYSFSSSKGTPEEEQPLIKEPNDETRIHVVGVPGSGKRIATLSGRLTESSSGQPIIGVSILVDEGNIGTVTDEDGYYKINIPVGYHVVTYQHIALQPTIRKIELYSNGSLNVSLAETSTYIDEVVVMSEKQKKEREVLGFERLDVKDVAELPSFMGEPDIIKHSLLLPGIQSAGEGDMSFNVRGGKGDQNLILIDGMHTYSHNHFFGFFPGINPNSIGEAELYKASLPVEYGSKLSSVYDISIQPGDLDELNVVGGVSPVTANITVDGPILKDKISYSLGARGTYSDWVLDEFAVEELENSSAGFYDYQGKVNYLVNSDLSASVFFYGSNDEFLFHQDTTYAFSNMIGSANINYQINEKTSLKTTIGYTNYNSSREEIPTLEKASMREQIVQDWKLNTAFRYFYNNKHTIKYGLEVTYNKITPWSLYKASDESAITPLEFDDEKALQGALFIGDEYKINPKFSVNLGIRYVAYSLLGPFDEYVYQDGAVITTNITDTTHYSSGESAYFDSGLELRLSASYKLAYNQYLNIGYDRNRQYIHSLTNSMAASPVDSWKLSNEYIPPQISDHVSLGYNIDINRGSSFLSVDLYYKKMHNIKDYINGSNFEFNTHAETEIVNAEGKSYGIELMAKRNKGRINGFISYTYSRTLIKSESEIAEKNINDGEYYPASFDKPHNLSLVLNVEPTRRLVLSNVINYSSGVPITLPVSKIQIGDTYTVIYSDRNEYRIPDYFRWDISLTYKGNLKKNKLLRSSWTLSVYNVTGRMNAYSIYYKNVDNRIEGYKLSIFGEPIPTLTYKFEF